MSGEDIRWFRSPIDQNRWASADSRFVIRRDRKFTLKRDAMTQYTYTLIDYEGKQTFQSWNFETTKRKAREWYDRN